MRAAAILTACSILSAVPIACAVQDLPVLDFSSKSPSTSFRGIQAPSLRSGPTSAPTGHFRPFGPDHALRAYSARPGTCGRLRLPCLGTAVVSAFLVPIPRAEFGPSVFHRADFPSAIGFPVHRPASPDRLAPPIPVFPISSGLSSSPLRQVVIRLSGSTMIQRYRHYAWRRCGHRQDAAQFLVHPNYPVYP